MGMSRAAGLFGLALLAAAPSVAALVAYGVAERPDSADYLAYATQIRTLGVPSGAALLHGPDGQASLFRMGGFPALLALLQTLFPGSWKLALAVAQIAAQAGAAAIAYPAARALGARPLLAAMAALLPAVGFAVLVNISVLTDAVYSAAVAVAAFALLLRPDWRGALAAGLLLALAMSFREATLYFALAYVPLALLARRRLLGVALLLAPVWAVAGAQMGWNMARGAGAVTTTSRQYVMVESLLPLLREGRDVFAEDALFAEVAARTIDAAHARGMDAFEAALAARGLTAPEISERAGRVYARAWRVYPVAMLRASVGRLHTDYLTMPFQPLATWSILYRQATGVWPDSNRMDRLWPAARAGDPAALGWLAVKLACQGFGALVSVLGMLGPWAPRAGWRVRALWCVPAGLVGLYMPVVLEARYLAPAVPLVCVLAAVAGTRLTRWRGRDAARC